MSDDSKHNLSDFGAISDYPPAGTYVRVPDDAMTADQQIRAMALECFAIAYAGSLSPDRPADFSHVQEFERYIREGK